MRLGDVIGVLCAAACLMVGATVHAAPRQTGSRPLAATDTPQAATWAWSAIRRFAGLRGMVLADNGADREVYLTDYLDRDTSEVWRALKVSGSGSGTLLTPFFSSAALGSEIVGLLVAEPAGGLPRRLLVPLKDGRQLSYDQASKVLLSSVNGPCALRGGLVSFSQADLDADGLSEQLSICQDGQLVVHHDAQVEWTLSGIGGDWIVVGQMDDDPALEIATTAGQIVDSASRRVQWSLRGGMGWRLVMADIDGDGRQELIASDTAYQIRAFDVDSQQLKWTARTAQDIARMAVADMDLDGRPDLVYADGQWGSFHVLDAATGLAKDSIANPGWWVRGMLVADLTRDGVPDILFTSEVDGGRGPNLQLMDGAQRAMAGASLAVSGPFVGPKLGDIDGDGVPDIVLASGASGDGRILVMDSRTLQIKATSPPSGGRLSLYGATALALRDIDGDGRLDVLVATDRGGSGSVEAYGMRTRGKLQSLWRNASEPAESVFTTVELADVDGDGVAEVLAGNRVLGTNSAGRFVYAYDLATGAEKWRQQIGSWGFQAIRGVEVFDLDGNGSRELVVMVPTLGTLVFDGATRQLLSQVAEDGNVLARDGRRRLVLAQSTGHLVRLAYDDSGLRVKSRRQPVTTSIDGLSDLGRKGVWFGSDGRLWRSDQCCSVSFESLPYGAFTGRETIVLDSGMVVTGTGFGLIGFMPP